MTKGKIYAEAMIQGFNIIGCDAFSPGPYDFAGGKDFLVKNLYKKALFPFISLNITDLDNELLYLKGSIPGAKNSEVIVRGSVKNIKKLTITEKLKKIEDAKKTPDKKKKK